MNKVVTICGSFKYKDEMMKQATLLEIENGYNVLQPVYGADDITFKKEDYSKMGEIHFRKIDMSEAIFVVNVDGYVGESTKREIEYARNKGKEILSLEPFEL